MRIMNIIEYPAAEECKTWKEYVLIFFERNKHLPKKEAGKLVNVFHHGAFKDRMSWFNWCWEQPEAQMIHSAYTGQ